MRSPFCEWLTQLSTIARKEDIIVEAQHIDALEFIFLQGIKPKDAWPRYKKFHKRWMALTDNGTNVEAV